MNIKFIQDNNTVIFKMNNSLEDIKLVAKQAPKALQVIDADKEILFAVACARTGYGSLNNIGAEFSPEVAADGKAKISTPIPADTDDVKLYLADEYGAAIEYLNKIDTQITAALETITQQRARIRDIIQVV